VQVVHLPLLPVQQVDSLAMIRFSAPLLLVVVDVDYTRKQQVVDVQQMVVVVEMTITTMEL